MQRDVWSHCSLIISCWEFVFSLQISALVRPSNATVNKVTDWLSHHGIARPRPEHFTGIGIWVP
jgi:hypothetical protein